MTVNEDDRDLPMTPAAMTEADMPRFENPIVPSATIAGRALVAVIAIMTFLASLTTGGVMLVRAAAGDWQSEVAREVTIQVRPAAGRDIEADVARAGDIARAADGVVDVRIYSREESARLLEPWLGGGLSLEDLPVPRIIVVRLASGAALNLDELRAALAEQVPSANLDDHRNFVERMRSMTNALLIGGIAVLILVLAATFLSVAFATRGAMAVNRSVIEVLHFIGARNDFIGRHFQRRFLLLGLQGGLIGGGSALVLFALAEIAGRWLPGTAVADQFAALFGTFSVGIAGYLAVVVQILLIAVVTAVASRITVSRTLETIQ
jgi:cell division transport system permease protein